MTAVNGVATNGQAEPAPLTPTGPTFGEFITAHRSRRATRRRPAWQRNALGAGAVMLFAPLTYVSVSWWVHGIARDEARRSADAVRDYVDTEYTASLGGEVATLVDERIAKGPTVVVKSNPLEAVVPCALTDDARYMIRDQSQADPAIVDSKLSEALSTQARALLASGVTPQQLRIYINGSTPALTNEAALGSALAAC